MLPNMKRQKECKKCFDEEGANFSTLKLLEQIFDLEFQFVTC